MKCPKCNSTTDFQVIVKNGKKYIQCDKCGVLLTSDDLKRMMQQPPPQKERSKKGIMQQSPPQKERSKAGQSITGLITLIVLIVIGVKLFSVFTPDDKAASTEQTKQQETDGYGWTKEDRQRFRAYTWSTSDQYVANYKKFSLDENAWKYMKFDDEGKIMVTTTYAFKNMNERQNVIFIFTEGEDQDEDGEPDGFYPHFLSIGNNIYVNDGSCNEYFQNLQESMQYFQ